MNAISRLNSVGIDMNFIKNICDNYFIERAKIAKLNQVVKKSFKPEISKSVNFKPADHFISLWTPVAINYATDLTNYELVTQKERKLKNIDLNETPRKKYWWLMQIMKFF